MPTEWQYHADGVRTTASTTHSLDGTLESVRVELDCFRVRSWTEEELDNHSTRSPDSLDYDSETDRFEEYGGGAHATLRFDVNDGKAAFESIEPEDGDRVEPRHMALLQAAERVVEQLPEIEVCWRAIETLEKPYFDAEDTGVHIHAIDG